MSFAYGDILSLISLSNINYCIRINFQRLRLQENWQSTSLHFQPQLTIIRPLQSSDYLQTWSIFQSHQGLSKNRRHPMRWGFRITLLTRLGAVPNQTYQRFSAFCPKRPYHAVQFSNKCVGRTSHSKSEKCNLDRFRYGS